MLKVNLPEMSLPIPAPMMPRVVPTMAIIWANNNCTKGNNKGFAIKINNITIESIQIITNGTWKKINFKTLFQYAFLPQSQKIPNNLGDPCVRVMWLIWEVIFRLKEKLTMSISILCYNICRKTNGFIHFRRKKTEEIFSYFRISIPQ